MFNFKSFYLVNSEFSRMIKIVIDQVTLIMTILSKNTMKATVKTKGLLTETIILKIVMKKNTTHSHRSMIKNNYTEDI